MGIPGTVQKVTLNFGPYFDHAGRPLTEAPFWIDCPAAPIHTADGAVVVKRRVRVITDSTGSATVELVANDAAGLSKTGFTYTVSGPESVIPDPVEITLSSSVPVADFDTLVPADASDGTVVFYPVDAVGPLVEESVAAALAELDIPSTAVDVGAEPVGLSSTTRGSLSATYVSFRKPDGTALTGKHVIITVTADGTDIQDITVEAL